MCERIRPPADEPQTGPVFEGEVLYADARQPVPGARVTIGAREEEQGDAGTRESAAHTDAAGRFRIAARSGRFFYLSVHPPEGAPYLIVDKRVELAAGIAPPKLEIALPRGVVVRGKILDADSGQPVPGSVIQYEEHSRNSYARQRVMPGWAPHPVEAESDAQGGFQIVATPGRGTLLIQGPNGYLRQTVENTQLDDGFARRQRLYVSSFVPLDLAPESEPAERAIAIRRGVTVRGRIMGPDGRPADRVLMLSRLFLSPHANRFLPGCLMSSREGAFELQGLDPEEGVPVYFLDPQNEIGAVSGISGRSGADGPLVVQLSPCGKAVARFVDPAGKPRDRYRTWLQIVVAPGPFFGDMRRAKGELCADQDLVANFDREHFPLDGSRTDGEGRCTFPALIPGATYRIVTYRGPGAWDERDFSVESGQTRQLDDIVVPS